MRDLSIPSWLESSLSHRAALVIHLFGRFCRVLLAAPRFLGRPFTAALPPYRLPHQCGWWLPTAVPTAFSGVTALFLPGSVNSLYLPHVSSCHLFWEAIACPLTTSPQCDFPSLSPKLPLHLAVSLFLSSSCVTDKVCLPLPLLLISSFLGGDTVLVIHVPTPYEA